MSERDDWGALAAEHRGDSTSHRLLLKYLYGGLTRFYALRLPPSVVEDAAQGTLMVIHEKRQTYDPSRSFKPWLIVVAQHNWIDRIRSLRHLNHEALRDTIAVPEHDRAITSVTVLPQFVSHRKLAQRDPTPLAKRKVFSIEEAARERVSQSLSLKSSSGTASRN
jgi:RNA polymerase sigma-70 factor (ECF subfamily)